MHGFPVVKTNVQLSKMQLSESLMILYWVLIAL